MPASLRRNALWQFVQTAGSTGGELLVVLALGAYLAPAQFGELLVALSGCKVAFMLLETRIHEFLVPKLARYAARHPAAAWAWTRLCVRIEFASNAAALTLCVALTGGAQLLNVGWTTELVLASAIYTGANTLLKFSSLGTLRSIGRIDSAALHAVVGAVVKLAVLAVLAHAGARAGVIVAMLAVPSLAVSLSQAAAARRLLRRHLGRVSQRTPQPLRHANRTAQRRLMFANYATGFAEIGHRELDMQILAATAGSKAAGSYRLAKMLAMLMLELLAPLVLVLLPEFVRRLADRAGGALRAFVARTTRLLAVLGGVAAVLVFASALAYLGWLAPEHWNAWPAVAVLVSGFALMAPTLWAQTFLVACGKPQVYLRSSLLGAALAVAAAWLLSPRFGAVGAAVAHIAGLLVANGAAVLKARQVLRGLPEPRTGFTP